MPPRKRAGSVSLEVLTNRANEFEKDASHHLTGPFMPQTPLSGSSTPSRVGSPPPTWLQHRKPSIWIRWIVQPKSSLKILLLPPFLYLLWAAIAPLVIGQAAHDYNPFAATFILSGRTVGSTDDDPRYAKTWSDLLFIAYYIVFFSFLRQVVAVNVSRRIARRYGIRKEAKLDRFGEQFYALFYFSITGVLGYKIMQRLPTFWYKTEYFWIDYPHWDMNPWLKRYYLMQIAYWSQQLLVLLLGLEKPRKDYYELIAHHFVTIWLVGWSYLTNLTLIGNAVYMSMDIPDAFLALSKLLNYLQMDRAKVVSFAALIVVWTYFRHILNFYILYSVWFEWDLIPETSREWIWADGTYLNWWMKYQTFAPLFLLQLLNLFWYFLIMRILVRALRTSDVQDERSDDEDDGEDDEKDE